MAIEITIPPLGWSADDGVFSGWLKRDGDEIQPGDELFSLEGDKATQEIESFDAGTLRILPTCPKVGDKVAVGTVIGYLLAAGESLPVAEAPQQTPVATSKSSATAEVLSGARPHATPAMRRLARSQGIDARKANGAGTSDKVAVVNPRREQPAVGASAKAANGYETPASRQKTSAKRAIASPRARRAAAELGVDWTVLSGGGTSGRIRECDVRAAAENATVASLDAAYATAQKLPHSTLRKTIAARMLESSQSTAAVTLTTTLDVTNLVNLRGQFKELAQASGIDVPSYTDFLAKLVAAALNEHPLLNARWRDDHVEVWPSVNIGIAVDTDAGLLVPVVRDVASLRLAQVTAQSRDLIERARLRKLLADEMQDGTFTITNLGALGIDAFTPIINYPQAAILGVGRIRREPTVVDNQIAIRDVMTLSLSFDHRIVDGAPAARFLQHLGELVKNPGPCLTA